MYYDGFVRSTNAKLCLALFYRIYLDNSILSALLDVCFLLSAVRLLFITVYMCRSGGQLVYTNTEQFPADGNAVEVRLSAADSPDLFYVQLCANLDR